MRYFRLLKNLPDHKAGKIFFESINNYIADTENKNGANKFLKSYVENNPEWFSDICDEWYNKKQINTIGLNVATDKESK